MSPDAICRRLGGVDDLYGLGLSLPDAALVEAPPEGGAEEDATDAVDSGQG